MNQTWLVFAVLTFFCWGISDFLPKIATNLIGPKSAYLYESIGRVLVGLIILVMFLNFKPDFTQKGFWISFIGGILGGLGMLFFFMAAKHGNISKVVMFTALYPVFTVVLAYFILKEPVSGKQLAGIATALVALGLLA